MKKRVKRRMDTLEQRARCLYFKNLIHPGSPVHVADSVFTGSGTTQPHHHDFYEFYLIRKGALTEYRQGAKNVFAHRSLVFVPPRARHCFSSSPEFRETRITNVAFPPRILTAALRFLNNTELQRKAVNGFILRDVPILLWERICRRIEQLRSNTTLACKGRESLFKTILIDLLVEQISMEPISGGKTPPIWLKEACDKMQAAENLQEGLKKFISLSGRTQEHLTRTLKKEMGKTPTEYINQLRLKKVISALASTKDPVTTIAYQAGFNNLSYFNALFKKEFGLPPRTYRNRQGQDVVPL